MNRLLFEVNARMLVERTGPGATLLDVPESYWRSLVDRGVDLVWLMGVWQRSAGSRRVALAEPGLRRAYDEALHGWTDDDVAGSPYAIAAYELDASLGGPDDLATLRRRLNDLGLRLILDFVPNHLALDHALTTTVPACFVEASDELAASQPGTCFRVGSRWLAHGRDPYFPAWTDTVQVDVFAAEGRQLLVDTLCRVAEVADGVRCDMAMLVLNDVFARTWAAFLGPDAARPPAELWTEAIDAVRRVYPRFQLIAEAYWGLEWRLHELGFDAFYDKTLYDRLRSGAVHDVREHLRGTAHWGSCAVRFVENHDEPRATAAFGDATLAAAVVVLTVPGVRFMHDGQAEGRRVRLPVQLVREPREPTVAGVTAAYERLLALVAEPIFRDGQWQLVDVAADPAGEGGHDRLLAWSWQLEKEQRIVVVNLGAVPSAGRVPLDGPRAEPRDRLEGLVGGHAMLRVDDAGLRVALGPHAACIV